ncbi:hypothetical protein OPT61_g1559 [Boeremia exigua]|uniref:Uncharacterized protein n=1 Tax=Boeremia exigua TaxID=749465 RepID=A0ACC2IPU7_9PLEO|nr:hypothetical protein OPT61_g1559 [Boeremia exigua]
MRFSFAGALLAVVVGSGQALRISDHVAHLTAASVVLDGGNITFTSRSAPPIPPRPAIPPPVPPRPTPRPPNGPYLSLFDNANDIIWENAKCKGTNFIRAMRSSDRDAGRIFKPPRDSAASEFEHLDFDAAEKWGWDFTDKKIAGDFKAWGLDHVLRDLGLSDKCYGWGGSLDCITFLHGLNQDEDGDWVPDDSTYIVDGQTYLIIALDRDSPRSTGRQLTLPVEGDGLPAIQASSDIMWLYWKTYLKPKSLNYFLTTWILNAESQGIISRAIRGVLPDAQSFPAWGGYDFDTDTPEGRALLGTPNAQAFSYLLLQHKSTLGNLYISSIRVFRDNGDNPIGPNLLLVVEPVLDDDDTTQTTEPYEDIPSLLARMAHPKGGFNTVNTAAQNPANIPAPKPLVVEPKPNQDLFGPDPGTYLDLYPDADDEQLSKAQCKGANFVRAMRSSDSEAGRIFDPPRDTAAGLYNKNNLGKDDLTRWGWSGKESKEPDMKYYGIDHVLRDIGSSDTLSTNGGDIRLVSFVHGTSKQSDNGEWLSFEQQHYEVDGKTYRYTGAWYNFALNEINGLIIATDRISPQEAGSTLSPPIQGSDLPLVRAFSDMAWMSWEALSDETKTDMKNIRYFMTISIVNTLTQRILSRCIRDVLPGAWGFPAWPGFEFESSSTQGQAILGTPNAQAFSYFLIQHKKQLGDLYISKIRVFHDSNWIAKANLLLVVEQVPAEHSQEETQEKPEVDLVFRASNEQGAVSADRLTRHERNKAKL